VFDLHRPSDLPRRAEIKVAWHLLDRRAAPSSKEGPNASPKNTVHPGHPGHTVHTKNYA
jgi:hypothetical protein